MRDLFASGRVVELILGFMLVEAVALGIYYRRSGRGVRPLDLAVSLAAGALLLLALRAVRVDPDPLAPAPYLAGALVAHLADLARRWRR
jgi:hypothetical protein